VTVLDFDESSALPHFATAGPRFPYRVISIARPFVQSRRLGRPAVALDGLRGRLLREGEAGVCPRSTGALGARPERALPAARDRLPDPRRGRWELVVPTPRCASGCRSVRGQVSGRGLKIARCVRSFSVNVPRAFSKSPVPPVTASTVGVRSWHITPFTLDGTPAKAGGVVAKLELREAIVPRMSMLPTLDRVLGSESFARVVDTTSETRPAVRLMPARDHDQQQSPVASKRLLSRGTVCRVGHAPLRTRPLSATGRATR
jgi:hypothetical protein